MHADAGSRLFQPAIPGSLIQPIVLGDEEAVAVELEARGHPPALLVACGRLAAANGRSALLGRLLDAGCPPDDVELHRCAAAGGWTPILELLRARGADLTASGGGLAVAAARGGHVQALRYLRQQGCDFSACEPLAGQLAARPSLRETFLDLSNNGVPGFEPWLPRAFDAARQGDALGLREALNGRNATACAMDLVSAGCASGEPAVLEMLEEAGCATDRHSRNALLSAAAANAHRVLGKLLSKDYAERDLADAADLALELGHAPALRELLRRVEPERIGAKALLIAEMNGHSDALKLVGRAAAVRPALAPPSRSPSVSLLLANYNDGNFLRTSLQAILAQTRAPDEIIIVDDGSTDDSPTILEEFAAASPRTRLLRHARNLGQHAAIQRALAHATGDYVVWASSDDLLLPRFMERAAEALTANPGVGLCFSQLCAWRESTGEVRRFTRRSHGAAFDLGSEPRSYPPAVLRHELRRRYLWISGNTVAARRDALLAMGGFDARLRWHADWFAFYAVALRHGACSIPETLAMMRERDATYSRAGMIDRHAQHAVLRYLIDLLRSPRNRDLYAVFRSSTPMLSPFGKHVILAHAFRVSTWHMMVPLFFWLLRRKTQALLGKLVYHSRALVSRTLMKLKAIRTPAAPP